MTRGATNGLHGIGYDPRVLVFLGIYLLGVLIGLARIDGSIPVRIGLALMWPLGPLAFAVTIGTLLLASAIAFPLFGALVTAAAIGAWIWIR